MEQVYRNAIGPCYTSITHGDTLIYGEGGYVVFSDITDLNNPQEITRFITPCYVEDFALDYPILYVADAGYGLMILDISDLNNITVTSEMLQDTEEKEVSFLQLNNNYLYARLWGYSIQIINISNSNSPEVVTEIEASGEYKLLNDTLYIIQQDTILVILDVDNPEAPVEIGTYVQNESFKQVEVYQDYIYLFENFSGSYAVLDASTPENPIYLTDISGDYMGGSIKVYNQYLLFYDPFSVYDLSSDPTNPTYVNHLEFDKYARHIQLNNGIAFIALSEYGLEIVDFELPQNMVSVSDIETGAAKNKVFIFENLAYIRAKNFGIHIYDIETPDNPNFISSFNLENSDVQDMAFDYPYAYLAYGGNGLIILNISDPANPIQVGAFNDYSYTNTVEKTGNYVCLNSNDLLKVIEVSDPVNPYESYSYQSGGFSKIEVINDYAYLAQNDEGLKILDISNLNNITEVGHLFFEDQVNSITVDGDFLYVSAMGNGFWIVNISDPTSPFLMGHYSTDHQVQESRIAGDFAILAERAAGITVLDISDPWNPVKVAYYNDPNSVPGIGVSGNYIVAANWSAGFYVAYFDESSVGILDQATIHPDSYILYPAYPNPFNPTTTIRFNIPVETQRVGNPAVSGATSLQIFSITGRVVERLVDGKIQPGNHEIQWNASPYSSGIYFVELRFGKERIVQKLLFLK